MKGKLLIVSNRLPFQYDEKARNLSPSTGGLVTAIAGIQSLDKVVWAGIAPTGLNKSRWNALKKTQIRSDRYHPIFVSDEEYDLYYNDMCNDVLWPLFHYESNMVKFKSDGWAAYIRVNQKIADDLLTIAKDDDMIWVHDFHLMLLPKFLKKKKRRVRVGFFLHVPFPSSEIFRQLPVRKEILDGVLHSDLIGFHDYSYLRHFCSVTQLVLGLSSELMFIRREKNTSKLGVFPVSINTKNFEKESVTKEVQTLSREYRRAAGENFIVLGVDRLDYIKGIELKLRAFRLALRNYSKLRGKVQLVQVAVPSRMGVVQYQRLKNEIDQLVGDINGEFGNPEYVPVKYMFSSVTFHELLALYDCSEALLVTSKRDGMNLVSLEYIAAQPPDNPGVVILSEFTGASSNLSEALIVNPWDLDSTSDAIARAVTMPLEERKTRHRAMLKYLREYTSSDWAQSFIKQLSIPLMKSRTHLPRLIPKKSRPTVLAAEFINEVKNKNLSVLLDYDGTVVPICDYPHEAIISQKTKRLIKKISLNKKIDITIVSGRNSQFLLEQFRDCGINMAAEHGAKFFDAQKKQWIKLAPDREKWYETAKTMMQDYAKRVPESFVEEKEFSISWHYRRSPSEFANYLSQKLKEELELGLANFPATILSGKKVIEARPVEANKGVFTRWYTNSLKHPSKVLAIGDDETDEEMFEALKGDGISIKVGEESSAANFCLTSQSQVLTFLEQLNTLVN